MMMDDLTHDDGAGDRFTFGASKKCPTDAWARGGASSAQSLSVISDLTYGRLIHLRFVFRWCEK